MYKIFLNSKHHFKTGFTTHKRDSEMVEQLPFFLQIEPNQLVAGEYYLIHYDRDNSEMADTIHDSIEDAMEQARLEYNVQYYEWMNV